VGVEVVFGKGGLRLSASVMRFLPALSLLLCLGCATTTFTKSGATKEVYERDEDVCQTEAMRWYVFYSESRYRDCMNHRGYVIR
jgi:hypothetical protein